MEQLLLRLARQLDALDEASLMALWDNYAEKVHRFEPTKRWEEAALVFSFIQAKRWKNQLFNHNWAQQVRPENMEPMQLSNFSLEKDLTPQKAPEPTKATQLNFTPKAPEST